MFTEVAVCLKAAVQIKLTYSLFVSIYMADSDCHWFWVCSVIYSLTFWPWVSLTLGGWGSWTLTAWTRQLTGPWLCTFSKVREGGVFCGSQTAPLLCCFTHCRISYRTSPAEKHTSARENTGTKSEGSQHALVFAHSYLSWGSGVWSPPWWAGTGLDRSSRIGPSLSVAVSTPSEPSGASGRRPLCPTETGLFLQNKCNRFKQTTLWLVELVLVELSPPGAEVKHREESLTHVDVQVDATGPPEDGARGSEAHWEIGWLALHALWVTECSLCFLAAKHEHTCPSVFSTHSLNRSSRKAKQQDSETFQTILYTTKYDNNNNTTITTTIIIIIVVVVVINILNWKITHY